MKTKIQDKTLLSPLLPQEKHPDTLILSLLIGTIIHTTFTTTKGPHLLGAILVIKRTTIFYFTFRWSHRSVVFAVSLLLLLSSLLSLLLCHFVDQSTILINNNRLVRWYQIFDVDEGIFTTVDFQFF